MMMRGWVKLMFIGNLTRDMELRKMNNGTSVSTLSAVVMGDKPGDDINYDVDVFSKVAEACVRNLRKGDPVFVDAVQQKVQWTDEKTGMTRTRIGNKARSVVFLPRHDDTCETVKERDGDNASQEGY